MTTGKLLRLTTGLLLVLVAVMAGCGDQSGSDSKSSPTAQATDDRALIQEALTEAIIRWHYGDKAALYDNEFEYLQAKYDFDSYLTFRQIEFAEADTVTGIIAQDYTFFGRDSCRVAVEIQFKGPSGKISVDHDKYIMYYHRGRWCRPTVGSIDIQREYDRVREQADSAAEAEERESGNG